MDSDRSVRLFRNGRNQAVRIPRDMELPGREALLRKQGDTLILVPKRGRGLLTTLRTLKPIRETLGRIIDRPAEPIEL
jgi:antitoxin VapB